VAFVIDAFAGTIRGWEATLTKETAFVQRAIAQACARLRRLGHPVTLGAIHHSDAGSQYTSLRFARTLLLEGLAGSAGSAGTPWTTPWRKRPSGSARPSAPGTGRRSATARCAAAATWRRSPPPGCTGTTPSGSCTAPGSCPRPRPTPRTGPATPEPRLAAGLDMGPSRAATPGPQGQAGYDPGPAAGQGYGRPPHVKPGSRPCQNLHPDARHRRIGKISSEQALAPAGHTNPGVCGSRGPPGPGAEEVSETTGNSGVIY